MNWARWERFAPLTGVVAVVLWIVGVIVQESAGLAERTHPRRSSPPSRTIRTP